MADRPPRQGWSDWTNVRTPSKREHRWAGVMLVLCLALAVAGAVVGGTAGLVLIVAALIPLLIWAYLERRTALPGADLGNKG
jgi:4-hydroxybenzoate polyprenyltransferase